MHDGIYHVYMYVFPHICSCAYVPLFSLFEVAFRIVNTVFRITEISSESSFWKAYKHHRFMINILIESFIYLCLDGNLYII